MRTFSVEDIADGSHRVCSNIWFLNKVSAIHKALGLLEFQFHCDDLNNADRPRHEIKWKSMRLKSLLQYKFL